MFAAIWGLDEDSLYKESGISDGLGFERMAETVSMKRRCEYLRGYYESVGFWQTNANAPGTRGLPYSFGPTASLDIAPYALCGK